MSQDSLKARRDAEDIRKAAAKRSSIRSKLIAGEKAQPDATAAEPAADQTYTVQAGDTLSGIAKKFLGDAGRWPEIFEANKDTIKDPNLIRVGQEIKLPAA